MWSEGQNGVQRASGVCVGVRRKEPRPAQKELHGTENGRHMGTGTWPGAAGGREGGGR